MNVSAFSVELNGADGHWGLYRLPVVTGVADLQEGGALALAWFEDPMVYAGTPLPK